MDNFSILFVAFIILNFLLFKQNNLIAKKIKLFDYPDNLRKIHLKRVAITGGLFIFINLVALFFVVKIEPFNSIDFFSEYKRQIVSFLFLIISLFVIGLYDDKYDLNAFKKLFFSAAVIFICLLIDENLVIKELKFYTANYSIKLFNLSIPFTLLSILLFVNAVNMFDGIDLQVSIYVSLIFLYLIFNFEINFLILLIPVMIFVIFFNFKKKLFLGDSGTNVLAGLLSFIIINEYNNGFSEIYCEEIFLLMLLPGIDMLRLFIIRILRGKNPFSSDNKHLHHLYLKKFSLNFTIFLIQLHIFLPILLFKFNIINISILIIFSILIYLSSLFYLRSMIKN